MSLFLELQQGCLAMTKTTSHPLLMWSQLDLLSLQCLWLI